uniref:Uncharacterized protein n=1 Tax=Romanomermis culicivorax TaxID=13658 RepID=A0A915KX35_ROMCU
MPDNRFALLSINFSLSKNHRDSRSSAIENGADAVAIEAAIIILLLNPGAVDDPSPQKKSLDHRYTGATLYLRMELYPNAKDGVQKSLHYRVLV